MPLIGNKRRFAFEVQPVTPSWELGYAPESAAWAALQIWVGDVNVCTHLAPDSNSIQPALYVPLGPIAEWFSRNWGALAGEERPLGFPSGAHPDPRQTYRRWSHMRPLPGFDEEAWYDARYEWWTRHFVAGEEDAPLPELGVVREGDLVSIGYTPVATKGEVAPQGGVVKCSWAEFAVVVREFVELVASELRRADAELPWLSKADLLSFDTAEALRLFTGVERSALERWFGPEHLARIATTGDFASSVLAQLLREIPPTDDIPQFVQDLVAVDDEPAPSPPSELRVALRTELGGYDTPVSQGHSAAEAVRERMDLDGEPMADEVLDDLLHRLGDPQQIACLSTAGLGPGLALTAEEGRAPRVAWLDPAQQDPWEIRFNKARAIGVLALDSYRGGVLARVPSSKTGSVLSRRRSGAFAAELLLPESGVAQFVGERSDAATQDEVFSALLSKYGIGAQAAANQLYNVGFLPSREHVAELSSRFSSLRPRRSVTGDDQNAAVPPHFRSVGPASAES